MSSSVKTSVIGHPISHSKSPLIHNYWIRKYALKGTYEAIDIPCENLKNGLQELIDQGYTGFNLTIPHKELVIPLCAEIDEIARSIGAVNTVIVEKGQLKGTNTDAFGFIENIRQDSPDFDFTAGQAAVLGAGGAARAVIYGLLEAGTPEIILLNRTREKAEKLIALSGDPSRIRVLDWENRDQHMQEVGLLINTTALGMTGQPPLELDLSHLPPEALVNDIVYAPLHTGLLKQAKERGNPVVTGIGMLLHQARPAFEKWFGILPTVDEELQKLVQT